MGRKVFPPVAAGARFGRLEVVRPATPYRPPGSPPDGQSWRRWECRCECEGIAVVRDDALRAGKARSCGCLVGDRLTERNAKHGHAAAGKSPTYVCWQGMIRRCENPNESGYADYGGRGIRICARWREGEQGRTGFECFLADMGERPSSGHSLDRFPDNSGHYEPTNCRWATYTEQNRNRRSNRNLTLDGRTMILTDWAREFGIHITTLSYRLRRGYPLQEALTRTPSSARPRA